MKNVAIIAAIAVAAAGCGSGSDTPPTPVSIAHQIGATGLHSYPKGPFASGAAEARWHGKDVIIAVFTSDTAKHAYIKAVSAFGLGKPLLSGPEYVVYPN